MRHMRWLLVTILLCTSSVIAQSPAITHLTVKPERTDAGDRLLVRWGTTAPADAGSIDVTALFKDATTPYHTTVNAANRTVIRKDELSEPLGCRFTAYIPLTPPLTLEPLTDLHVDANATPHSADATTPAATIHAAVDVDLDAMREFYQTADRAKSLASERDKIAGERDTIASERDMYRNQATKRKPVKTIDPPSVLLTEQISWTNALLLRLQSNQAVKATVELYRLQGEQRAGTSADDSASSLLSPHQAAPLRFAKVASDNFYEAEVTLRDARTNGELARNVFRTTTQGDPLRTLVGTTPLPQARFLKNALDVTTNHTLDLPLNLTNTKRVVIVLETKNEDQNWIAQDPITREINPPAGTLPMRTTVTIPANLPIGDNYRVKVRALSPVEEAILTQEHDMASVRSPSPIATKVQIEFAQDALRFTAPTADVATIGVGFTGQVESKGASQSNAPAPQQTQNLVTSSASKNPVIAIPLSTLTSIPAGTPFEFTVLVKAADDTGREYKQTVSLAVDQAEVKAKPDKDKTSIKTFATALSTGQDARLDSRTLLRTGLAAFLQVVFKGVFPALGVAP